MSVFTARVDRAELQDATEEMEPEVTEEPEDRQNARESEALDEEEDEEDSMCMEVK